MDDRDPPFVSVRSVVELYSWGSGLFNAGTIGERSLRARASVSSGTGVRGATG